VGPKKKFYDLSQKQYENIIFTFFGVGCGHLELLFELHPIFLLAM
jgi:hypothetical protein